MKDYSEIVSNLFKIVRDQRSSPTDKNREKFLELVEENREILWPEIHHKLSDFKKKEYHTGFMLTLPQYFDSATLGAGHEEIFERHRRLARGEDTVEKGIAANKLVDHLRGCSESPASEIMKALGRRSASTLPGWSKWRIGDITPEQFLDVLRGYPGPEKEEGIKHDDNKLQLRLIPWESLREVGRVIDYGARRYGEENWKKVDPPSRYQDALLRHVLEYLCGETHDKETGFHHLAHAATNCLFLIYLETTQPWTR